MFSADCSERLFAAEYVENAPAVAVEPRLVVTDVDSANLAGATITVTGYVAGEDVLSSSIMAGSRARGMWRPVR